MHKKGKRTVRGMVTSAEVVLLREALASARLEECALDDATKDRIRPYMLSWVAGPINRVLAGLESRHRTKIEKESINAGQL